MNEINIVMIMDKSYAMPTCVAAMSIACNKKIDTKVSLYLICDNVDLETKEKICSISNNFNDFFITCIDVKSDEFAGLEKSYSSVSKAALLKFRIPELLEELDKVLYLDGDIIVKKDLFEFYNQNIENYYAGVISDGPKDKIEGGEKHSFYGEKNYFNSGVMLLNLKRMRKDDCTSKLIDYRMNGYNYFMDQDAFNIVLGKNVLHFSLIYDFLLHLISFRNSKYSIEQVREYYNLEAYNSLDELFSDVVVYHYTFDKPWKYYDIPMNEIWMSYYQKTPFYDKNIQRKSFMTQMYNSRTYSFSRKLGYVFVYLWKLKKKYI